MAAKPWPDASAPYEFKGGDDVARKQWQDALNAARESGSLALRPRGGDFYDLDGTCPRCGHHMGQSIEFSIIRSGSAAPQAIMAQAGTAVDSITQDVVCSCTETHAGRVDPAKGCGWGRGLSVKVSKTPPPPVNAPAPAPAKKAAAKKAAAKKAGAKKRPGKKAAVKKLARKAAR